MDIFLYTLYRTEVLSAIFMYWFNTLYRISYDRFFTQRLFYWSFYWKILRLYCIGEHSSIYVFSGFWNYSGPLDFTRGMVYIRNKKPYWRHWKRNIFSLCVNFLTGKYWRNILYIITELLNELYIQCIKDIHTQEITLNKLSQLGTKRTPYGGQHFRIVYGGFWRSMGPW